MWSSVSARSRAYSKNAKKAVTRLLLRPSCVDRIRNFADVTSSCRLLVLCALLVGNSARGFACGLAGCLAFAAADIRGFKASGLYRLYVLHCEFPPDGLLTGLFIIHDKCIHRKGASRHARALPKRQLPNPLLLIV